MTGVFRALPRVLMMPRRQHGRARDIIATVAVATAVVAGAALIPGVTGTPTAPSGADIWVATNGNDSTCVRGDQAFPCATFNKAISLASCGDEVLVMNGTYGDQSVTSTTPQCAEATPVVVSGQSQAGVTVGRISVNTEGTPPSQESDRPGYFEFKDMTVTGAVNASWGKLIARNIDGGVLYNYQSDTRTYGNDWGPCYTGSGGPNCNSTTSPGAQQTQFDEPRSVISDGDTWHDFVISDDTPDAHFECIQWFGMGSGTAIIRNAHFYHCVTYGIYFTQLAQQYVGDIILENNWFGRACNNLCNNEPTTNRSSSIMLGAASNVLIRYNSFVDGSTVMTEGDPGSPPGSNDRIIGNIFGYKDTCQSGVTYDYNVWNGSGQSGTCGTNGMVASVTYTNPSSGASGDYHLTGSTLAFEDWIPNLGSDYALTTDRDGDTRPAGSARDAGSDER